MQVVNSANKENENMTYYTMNMPEWFFELSNEKKIELAKKFAAPSPSDEKMSKEDVLNLLSKSAGN